MSLILRKQHLFLTEKVDELEINGDFILFVFFIFIFYLK